MTKQYSSIENLTNSSETVANLKEIEEIIKANIAWDDFKATSPYIIDALKKYNYKIVIGLYKVKGPWPIIVVTFINQRNVLMSIVLGTQPEQSKEFSQAFQRNQINKKLVSLKGENLSSYHHLIQEHITFPNR